MMFTDIFATDKKYDIIYADPPWDFTKWSDKTQRHVTTHYHTMSAQDIKALPVNDLAADNAVLLLWATFPQIQLALDTIKAWGFKYKTCAFTWVKQNKKSPTWFWGLGYYTRSNAEVCLLATKGKPLARCSHRVHSVITSPVERHSKKPDETRTRIVELFGDRPRIELFARETADGWDCWGDEV
jgi:N6-adenosine-specific RNA methylase IME4